MNFLWWSVIGLITGWKTGKSMKGFGYGPLMDGVMGIAGALAGGFIVQAMMGPSGATALILTTLGAILGALGSTGLVGLASGKRRYA